MGVVSELRWHPFLGQWVITATHRQDRTFHPPADYCPLCPTKPGGFPTEIPHASYDIAVFENKFPSLHPTPPDPAILGTEITPVRKAGGVCEVVCYSDKHDSSLATLPLNQVRKLTRVWRERLIDLSGREGIEYVFIFENKGKEIGVTLSHPHGQIYAFPFIPPTMTVELEQEKRHFEATGRRVFDDWLQMEQEDGRRIFWQNDSFALVVPFFARYPYEICVAPLQPAQSLADLDEKRLDDLAETILVAAKKLDSLFGFSMPYIMAIRQAPAGRDWPWTSLRVEFYPPYRTENKLKYLAGSESAAGAFINDTLPEDSAARLRDAAAEF